MQHLRRQYFMVLNFKTEMFSRKILMRNLIWELMCQTLFGNVTNAMSRKCKLLSTARFSVNSINYC